MDFFFLFLISVSIVNIILLKIILKLFLPTHGISTVCFK